MELLTLEGGSYSWYLFPVYGLSVENDANWRNSLFGDATFVKTSLIKEYYNSLIAQENAEATKKRMELGKSLTISLPANLTMLLICIDSQDLSESEIEETKNETKKISDIMLLKAKNRAFEIIGFVYFVFFYSSYYRCGISLDSQIYSSNGNLVNVLTSNKGFENYQSRLADAVNVSLPYLDLEFNISQLKAIFNQPQFTNLFLAIHSNSKSEVTIPLRSAISHYYVTSNVPSKITQLLGAATTIEIIFKKEIINTCLFKRIRKIFTPNILKMFHLEIESKDSGKDLFSKRNEAIHEGKDFDSNDALLAIEYASYCIITYSLLMHNFNDKEEFLNYIDDIIKNDVNDNKDLLNQIVEKISTELFCDIFRKQFTFYSETNATQLNFKRDFATIVIGCSNKYGLNKEVAYYRAKNELLSPLNPFASYHDFLFFATTDEEIDNRIKEMNWII